MNYNYIINIHRQVYYNDSIDDRMKRIYTIINDTKKYQIMK